LRWSRLYDLLLGVAFFFSSRRRHTRFSRDWSSDVCSSDLLNSESLIKITRYNFIPTVFIAKVFAELAFNQLSENTLTGIIINIYSLKNFQDNNDFIVARFYKQPEFGLRKGNL